MCRNIALVLTLLVATVAFAVNTAADQQVRDDMVSIIDQDVGSNAFVQSDVLITEDRYLTCAVRVPQLSPWPGVLNQATSDSYCTRTELMPKEPLMRVQSTSYGACGDKC